MCTAVIVSTGILVYTVYIPIFTQLTSCNYKQPHIDYINLGAQLPNISLEVR